MSSISSPLLRRIAIIAGWLLINGFFLVKNGIVTSGEAGKYIFEAHYLVQNGHLASHNYIFYSVLIFLLAACIKFHWSFAWVIALQSGFALAATLSFHKTVLFLLRSPAAAFTATTLLLLNLPYQSLNGVLQTESLFHSVSLLLICSLLRQNPTSRRHLPALILTLLFLTVIRPTGLLYWPIAGIYAGTLALTGRPLAVKLIAAALAGGGLLVVINFAMSSGGDFDFTLPFREEHIICGVPTLLSPSAVPASGSDSTLFSLLSYILHDFRSFIRLAGLKTVSFWAIYRNYYSVGHNAYLALYFYPIIVMALLSYPSWKRRGQGLPFLLLATPVAITWLTVLLSCDDWNNRFFLGISPFLILLAAGIWPRKAAGPPQATS